MTMFWVKCSEHKNQVSFSENEQAVNIKSYDAIGGSLEESKHCLT